MEKTKLLRFDDHFQGLSWTYFSEYYGVEPRVR